jgi:hypothetical protein
MVDQAIHSAELGRAMAFIATGGKEGVVLPTDLKVSAVPGASVNIAPGGYAALNRYPNNPGQSYAGRAETLTNLAVPAVGAGGARSDAILLRIDDPEYGGTVPADRTVGPYEKFEVKTNVSSALEDAADLGLAYPAILLARIDRAANAATVVANDIKDMRQLVRPRYSTETLMTQPDTVAPFDELTEAAFRNFPIAWTPSVKVPKWATHYTLISTISAAGALGGDAYGDVRTVFGASISANVGYDTTSSPDGARVNLTIAASAAVPAGSPGTSVPIIVSGKRTGGAGRIRIQSGTTVIHQIQFFEKIV